MRGALAGFMVATLAAPPALAAPVSRVEAAPAVAREASPPAGAGRSDPATEPSPGAAGQRPEPAFRALAFASYLLAHDEPELAEEELLRAADLLPAEQAAEARRRGFALALKLGWMSDAARLVDAMTRVGQPEAGLAAGDLYAAAGDAGRALEIYMRARRDPRVGAVVERHRVLLALKQRWWGEAIAALADLADRPGQDKAACQALAARIAAWRDRPHLDPDKARLLSVVPGLGQWYAGEREAGLGSAAINGAVGLATLLAVLGGDYVGAGVILSVGSRYYYGGIKHAGAFVDERLAREEAAFVADVQRDLKP